MYVYIYTHSSLLLSIYIDNEVLHCNPTAQMHLAARAGVLSGVRLNLQFIQAFSLKSIWQFKRELAAEPWRPHDLANNR